MVYTIVEERKEGKYCKGTRRGLPLCD